MKKDYFIALAILLGGVLVSAGAVYAQGVASAPGLDKLGYPIAELGNCKNQGDCMKYCDNPKNMTACVAYGEKEGLMTPEQAKMARKVAERVSAGTTPGKCTTKESCEKFCSGNTGAIKECVAFAEELGVLPPEELAQAKKVVQALEKGAKMPGACTDKKSCETYCAVGANIDECLNFAEAAGMLSAEQLAEAKKVAPFLKEGKTPGKCTTAESCKKYCDDDKNFTECIGFAEMAGFVSKEDAERARKVGGKGPGNCKGKEECTAYCNDEKNADECFNFAADKGLIPAEDLEKARQASAEIKKGLDQVPAEARVAVESCLKDKMGAGEFDRIMAGGMPKKSSGEAIGKCFEDTMKNFAEQMKQKAMDAAKSQINANMPNIPGGGAGGPSNIPAGVPENLKGDIDRMQNAGRAPTAEEIQEIQRKAMEAARGSMPQGIPQGFQR